MKFSRLFSLMVIVVATTICCTISKSALAYNPREHMNITKFAFDILREMYPGIYDGYLWLNGEDPQIRNMNYEARDGDPPAPPKPPSSAALVDRVAWESLAPDYYRDLEFVDVEGTIRDNPHRHETILELGFDINDDARYSTARDLVSVLKIHKQNFTAFNHFIDVRSYHKSRFDDYDGYSYQLSTLLDLGVIDEVVMFYLDDEYVHAPGQKWYNGCSPSVERYSFPTKYPTKDAELKARFPLAESVGGSGGIPYTVFLPVDNMARYWYGRFLDILDPLDLGPVMHAIQDASVPHHAAGILGNWHARYEEDIADYVHKITTNRGAIKALVKSWDRTDIGVPESLEPGDYAKIPAINWDIEELVTWVALNAYRQYEAYYDTNIISFELHPESAELIRIATAMSVLVLKKALPILTIIDTARDGDTVLIDEGEYVIEGNVLDFKGRSITLKSADGVNARIKVRELRTSKGVVTFRAGKNSTITISP